MWLGALLLALFVGVCGVAVGLGVQRSYGPLASTVVLSWLLGVAVFLWGAERLS